MTLLTLALLGCVPKAKYDAALAESATKGQEIDRLNARIADLEASERKLQTDLAQANEALESKRRELARMASEAGLLAKNVEEMEQALKELEERRARAEANLKAFRDLVERFRSMIDAGTLKVKVIDGRMIVELATDILFPPGGASLSADGKKAITEVASVLASIPDRDFQVAGHTDNQPIATQQFPSNWHLGSARAIEVARVLVDGGLAPERVSAASYAEYVPADSNKTKEGRANNRRIEIIVVPDLTSMPGFDELKALEK
ncbi:MAG: OmpA family protein [Alphaproteobacteria bacterium]|nr:OmpA family protein [Alphaproteobacteria bacterium]